MSIHTSAMSEITPSPQAMADARDWFARLIAGQSTAAERMEFQRWQAEPEHAAAFAAAEGVWGAFGELKKHPEIDRLTQEILARTSVTQTQRTRRRRMKMAIAASVAACVIGLGAYFAVTGAQPDVYSTARGERSTMTLADGSKIFLSSATELEVRLDKSSRRFQLRRGEALFVVAPDRARPFTVSAGDGRVTALGTRFQVRNDAHRIVVTLLDGAVALDRSETGEHLRLAPGDQAGFTPEQSNITRRTIDPELAASWATGWLRFRSTPLVEVLEDVNRHSTVRIVIADPTLNAATPISGTFEVGDSASVVSALESLLPIEAVRRGEGEILLRNR